MESILVSPNFGFRRSMFIRNSERSNSWTTTWGVCIVVNLLGAGVPETWPDSNTRRKYNHCSRCPPRTRGSMSLMIQLPEIWSSNLTHMLQHGGWAQRRLLTWSSARQTSTMADIPRDVISAQLKIAITNYLISKVEYSMLSSSSMAFSQCWKSKISNLNSFSLTKFAFDGVGGVIINFTTPPFWLALPIITGCDGDTDIVSLLNDSDGLL